jgi:hypothetical protein
MLIDPPDRVTLGWASLLHDFDDPDLSSHAGPHLLGTGAASQQPCLSVLCTDRDDPRCARSLAVFSVKAFQRFEILAGDGIALALRLLGTLTRQLVLTLKHISMEIDRPKGAAGRARRRALAGSYARRRARHTRTKGTRRRRRSEKLFNSVASDPRTRPIQLGRRLIEATDQPRVKRKGSRNFAIRIHRP